MTKKSKRKRTRPRQRRRQQTPPTHDWQLPFPPLGPEDRLSTVMDYREFIPDYDEFVAEVGKDALEEEMDYFYFFLGNSDHLTKEREFRDVKLGIDSHDFLVYAAHDFLIDMVNKDGSIWDPEGGLVKPYEHIVQHAIARHLTPALRADLQRRARRTARRRRGTGIGSMAQAVEVALDDEGTPIMIITLVPQLFSDALIQSVLDHAERYEQEWEERDRSLDRWMEQIAAADFDQPAEQAVERLAAAGPRAMPHVAHLFYDMDLEYDDYPVATALEIAARIPSQLSLRFLVQALFDDDDWISERAAELLAGLPDLACPYLIYALTVPDGPDWETALWGYSLLGKARCPGAFDILVDGLSYQGKGPYDAEVGQISAAEGLLELWDERAIPILHDYLRDPQADLRARGELLYTLLEHEGGHLWGPQIAGDLTPDTLPPSTA
jgi:HEAT repeat protein